MGLLLQAGCGGPDEELHGLAFFGEGSPYGEQGEVARGEKYHDSLNEAGPVVLFPDPTTLYVSFFSSTWPDGLFSGTPKNGGRNTHILVCYRKSGDGEVRPEFDDSPEELDAADSCAEQSNGWIRVEYTEERDNSGFPANPPGYTFAPQLINKYGNIDSPFQEGETSDFYIGHYRAVIPGLQPDTVYEYRILRGKEKFANRIVLRTPPAPQSRSAGTVRFAVMADLHTFDGFNAQDEIRNRLRDQVQAGLADFVILPGDISNQSGTSAQYFENYFTFYRGFQTALPFYPIHGNHDLMTSTGIDMRKSSDGMHFFNMFDLPPNPVAEDIRHKSRLTDSGWAKGYRAFYSFDWGNVHFIALDVPDYKSEGFNSYEPGSPQYQWLEWDLLLSQQQKWRIAYFHAPLADPGNQDDPAARTPAQESLRALLWKYKVHLVVNGHWEFPTFHLNEPNQVPWVVVGSGGARSKSYNTYLDYEERRRKGDRVPSCYRDLLARYGIMAMEVTPDAIQVRAIGIQGDATGEVTITQDKDGHPVVGASRLELPGCGQAASSRGVQDLGAD